MGAFHSAWIRSGEVSGAEGVVDALFPWWSFTKTVLAASVLILAERGMLQLDAPFRGRPFTLRQLLTHRAGVPSYGALESYHAAVARGDDAWSRETLLKAVDADRLSFTPGNGWAYSNVGYLLVREAIEAATGQTLDVALERLVLQPLGLDQTRVAMGRTDFQSVHWPTLHGYDPEWVYHGCLIGPPIEAARLLHALATGEGVGHSVFEAMQARRTPLGPPPLGRPGIETAYGVGVMMWSSLDCGPAIGHTGAGPHCVNAIYHFPKTDTPITVAVFTDGEDEGAPERRAETLARRHGTGRRN